MKRNTIIAKLADIGRNPVKLSKMSNEELRLAMIAETEALAARAAHNARLAAVQQQELQRRIAQSRKHQAQLARRREHEAQQASAERYRLDLISRPVPPISTFHHAKIEDVCVNTMIRERRIRVSRLTKKLPYMGGEDFRKTAAIIRGDKETIKALLEDVK